MLPNASFTMFGASTSTRCLMTRGLDEATSASITREKLQERPDLRIALLWTRLMILQCENGQTWDTAGTDHGPTKKKSE